MANKTAENTETAKSGFERYSVFQSGGKQYQAVENKTVAIEKLEAKEGDTVTFSEVLFRKTGENKFEVGQPFVNAAVKAVVLKHEKGPKVIAFKFKRRKKYMRKQGHRQWSTIVRIQEI